MGVALQLGWERDESASDETIRASRGLVPELNKTLEGLGMALGRELRPGWARCPAACQAGKVLPLGDPCRVCQGKGEIPCLVCARKGKVECSECAGEGRAERACEDCLGSGRLPDPALVAAELRAECSWCGGAGVRGCSECKPSGFVDAVCRTCRGKKELVCGPCAGTRMRPCGKCRGSGAFRSVVSQGKTVDCDPCGKKGRVPCLECTKGTIQCSTCSGVPRTEQTCLACGGNRKRPCFGCFRGDFHHWEVAAELLAAVDPAAAALYLEHARERLEPYFERRTSLLGLTPAEKAAVERERTAARRRLERIDSRIPRER